MLSSGTDVSAAASISRDAYTDLNSLNKINQLADKDQSLALKELSKQFESIFVNLMLKTMRQANEVFEKDSLFNGGDTKFYRDMYDQQLALNLSTQGGIGLAESFYQQISSQYTQNQPAALKEFATPDAPFRAAEANANLADKSLPVTNSAPAMAVRAESSESMASSKKSKQLHQTKQLEQTKQPLQMSGPATSYRDNIDFSGSPQDFVKAVYPLVQRGAAKLGISPDVLIAQSALETGWGKFVIKDADGNSTNNLFNIKADSRWRGEHATVTTVEFDNHVARKEVANFRQYQSMADSVNDYVDFIANNPRYQQALQAKSPEDYIKELHSAGYATDPDYTQKVLRLFESQSIRATVDQHQPSLSASRG